MDHWSIGLLLALLLVASWTDITRHKIYNWTTYPGIAVALGLSAAEFGAVDLSDSFAGFFACGAIMLVCFVLFNMGGGDLKLIAMMGAFLGLHRGIEAMLWTFVLGGIMGTAILIWEVGVVRLVTNTVKHLWLVIRARGWLPLTEEERKPLRRWLVLAPSALAAVCVMLLDDRYRVFDRY